MYACRYIYVYMYLYTCTHDYVYIRIYTSVHIYVYWGHSIGARRPRNLDCKCMCAYIWASSYLYIHIYIYMGTITGIGCPRILNPIHVYVYICIYRCLYIYLFKVCVCFASLCWATADLGSPTSVYTYIHVCIYISVDGILRLLGRRWPWIQRASADRGSQIHVYIHGDRAWRPWSWIQHVCRSLFLFLALSL